MVTITAYCYGAAITRLTCHSNWWHFATCDVLDVRPTYLCLLESTVDSKGKGSEHWTQLAKKSQSNPLSNKVVKLALALNLIMVVVLLLSRAMAPVRVATMHLAVVLTRLALMGFLEVVVWKYQKVKVLTMGRESVLGTRHTTRAGTLRLSPVWHIQITH